MLYIVVGAILVCLAAAALFWDRDRDRAARWSLGLAALLGVNLLLYALINVLRSL